LRLSRRRGCSLARAIARLASVICPGCVRLARAHGGAGQSSGRARSPQHAFGEESLPDACQEYDRRPVPALLAAGDGARRGGAGRMPALRAVLVAGILATRKMLPARVAPPE